MTTTIEPQAQRTTLEDYPRFPLLFGPWPIQRLVG